MSIRTFVFIAFAISASFGALAAGVDTVAFQMPLAMALATALVRFLPKPEIAGLARCDSDPVEQIKELGKSLRETREQLTKEQTDLKAAHAKVMDAIEKGVKLDPEVKASIDAEIAKANDTAAALKDIAQSVEELRKSSKERNVPATVAGVVEKALSGESKEAYEQLRKSESNRMRLVLKEITTASFSTGLAREPYIDSMVSLERPPLRIRDLLTVIPVNTDSVKYGKQVLRDNKARVVAEGTKKPYSNYRWEDATASVEVIAHLGKMTLQALADAPRLAAEIESEMRFGLAFAEEDEILNGDGSTGHLDGILANSTPYAVPTGMETANILTPVDRLRVAMLQIHLAYAVPDAHVLNPINLAEMELMRRDPDNGGGYVFGNPDRDTGVTRLWRLRVVETPAMEVGEFLTGAFKYSVHLYQRQGVQVLISTENDTDFEDNKATMRVESRIGVGVRRPYGLVHGSLGDTTP